MPESRDVTKKWEHLSGTEGREEDSRPLLLEKAGEGLSVGTWVLEGDTHGEEDLHEASDTVD